MIIDLCTVTRLRAHKTHNGVQFIQTPHRLYPQAAFRNALPIPQRRLPSITTTRHNFVYPYAH
jgi:hypothetical protein